MLLNLMKRLEKGNETKSFRSQRNLKMTMKWKIRVLGLALLPSTQCQSAVNKALALKIVY